MKLLRLLLLVQAFWLMGAMLDGSAAQAAFNAGRITEDVIFTNKNSMSAAEIQTFFASKLPTCETTNEPCIRDYSEGGKSAAQIIWENAQLFNLNPQVIIVTLQKENGLITNKSPAAWRYRTAMGFACPDNGTCDPNYYGFTKQVYQGARHLRNFYDQTSGWIIPYRPGVAHVKWHPSSACGGSDVNISNRSTAALYSYTPYQPNAAALAAGYGTGDACSSYGNRNYYNYSRDWFPQVTVIQQSGDDRLFISEAGITKRWIPSPEVHEAWGFDTYPVVVVSGSYFNSIPEKPAISRITSDSKAVYYLDGGKRHWIPSKAMGTLWGIDVSQSKPVADFTSAAIPKGEPLGRFMKSSDSGDGRVFLMDVGNIHHIGTPAALDDWGFVTRPGLTTMSPEYIASKALSGTLDNAVVVSGTAYQMIKGQPYALSNSNLRHAWGIGSVPATNIDPLKFLPTSKPGTRFLQAAGDGKVYLADGGTLRHIPDAATLSLWGFKGLSDLTKVHSSKTDAMTEGAALGSYVVRDSDTNRVYILNGAKQYVPDTATLNAWTGSGQTIPSHPTETMALLTNASDAGMILQAVGDGRVFSLNRGKKVYMPSRAALDAWGYKHKYPLQYMPKALAGKLATDGNASYLVSSGGTTYLLNAGKKHALPSGLVSQYSLGTPQAIDTTTAARFATGTNLARTAKIGGQYYIVEQGRKIALGRFADAFGADAAHAELISDYFPTKAAASFLARSTDGGDGRVWLVANGKKYYVDTLEKLSTLGYPRIVLLPLSPAALTAIPTQSGEYNPLLMQRAGSPAVALVVGSGFLAFADLETLSAWTNGQPGFTVSDSVFGSYGVKGIASRLVSSSDGRIYWIENGTKRWIRSFATYYNNYRHHRHTSMPAHAVNLLPSGASID